RRRHTRRRRPPALFQDLHLRSRPRLHHRTVRFLPWRYRRPPIRPRHSPPPSRPSRRRRWPWFPQLFRRIRRRRRQQPPRRHHNRPPFPRLPRLLLRRSRPSHIPLSPQRRLLIRSPRRLPA
ncbi:unnamed protein product, partial [Musa acuminata subsp. burmannicoides]